MKRLFIAAVVLVLGLAPLYAQAHVGSPDVVFDGQAGPYTLLVSVRPPEVIPGVAEILVQALPNGPHVDRISVVPLPLSGPGAQFAPTPDEAQPMAGAVQSWQARLWMMSTGAWQVRLSAHGAAGDGELRVPVPALPVRTKTMQAGLGLVLLVLGLILGAGVVSIVGASVREGQLDANADPDPARRRRSRTVMTATTVVVALAVWGGNRWWNAEAARYAGYIYKPVSMDASLDGAKLALTLRDPGWLKSRRLNDLVPDHDHLMHLFAVRLPALDRVLHLHPDQTADATFSAPAPAALEPGRWQLFGDIVHESGLPETAVATIEVGAHPPGALGPDDAAAMAPALGSAAASEFALASGGRVVRLEPKAARADGKPTWLRFRVDEADGTPTQALELYMGMLGHAAVMRDDESVFAHLHPSGSVPMASLMIAVKAAGQDPHALHQHQTAALPAEIGFPYVFPRAGRYRVFVQFKRRGAIETAAFDLSVDG
jgi:hypothetical protein